ncbi:MAG: pyruvate carboxyltransferase [Deltaproteobacteria bacterium]|nr:pyruvate carboxyltransferase [Deltaproteobacteria bacterium]
MAQETNATCTPWKTADWFVSPWNYADEITKDFKPPKKVKIHDVTLRDGEQQAGIIFTKDDKIRIAEKLAEAGVHRIEAGMPAVSPMDEAAIKEIVKHKLGPEIFCFSRCMVDDVKRAADCGADGIVIEIPASKELVEQAYKWPMERAIDLSIQATACARENNLYTVFFTIDGTRAGMDFLLNLVDKVAKEGHMDAFTLVDTFGVLSPHGARYFTRKVRERVKTPLEIHFHSDFALGVANTIMAVLEGAEVIHSTVGGIGERCGNAPLEETALALLTLYGINTGLHFGKLNELSRLVADLAGIQVPQNRPFVGEKAYSIESGIVTNWFRNAYQENPTTVFPVHPSFVGHETPQIVLGKKSGIDNLLIWAEKHGLSIAEEKQLEVVARVKKASHDLKRNLTPAEFKRIVEDVQAGR